MYPFYVAEIIGVDGQIIDQIDDIISLQAARSFNTDGAATLVIPDDKDRAYFDLHTRMKLWRYDHRGVPLNFGDTIWFLKKKDHSLSERTFKLEFVDAFAMLNTRIVAYTSLTPYADKTLEEFALITYNNALRTDNMLRAYVRENFGSLALDSDRINSYISIETDKNLGPYGEKQAAWQDLDSVLSDIAQQASANGLNLYYDLIPASSGTFLFRVWTKVRGVDRGGGTIIDLTLNDSDSALEDIHEILDWTNVATVCYALGYDSGPSQVIERVESPNLVRHDPFGRIEMTINATDSDVPSVLRAAAQAALNGRRAKRLVTARVVETNALRYGDILYGDVFSIEVAEKKYSVAINAISTNWTDAGENLEMHLSGEEALTPLLSGGPEDPGIEIPGQLNTAPSVDAGNDQEIGFGEEVVLTGSAVDDGLPDPPGALTYLWSVVSGPGDVTFLDATDPTTTASFSEDGTYVLRLTASDSLLNGYDDITVAMSSVWVPPEFGDPEIFYGDMNAYIVWDGIHIGRTLNLQAAPPVWTNIGDVVTGTIIDIQYFMVDEDTVGMWALTLDGVWVCMDALAVTVTWESKLTLAEVLAVDVEPSDGTLKFGCMVHYWSQPGHLCVAIEPDGTPTTPASYLHAYFAVTTDYGDTWTHVDMNSYTFTSDSITRCYAHIGNYGMEAFRSAPGTLYAVRNTSRTSIQTGRTAVFVSSDLGLTWTKRYEWAEWSASNLEGSILHPFPNANSASYVSRGLRTSGSTGAEKLWLSTDEWVTATQVLPPADHLAGYGHSNVMQRVNKHTFEEGHILMEMLLVGSSDADLYESDDYGATWVLLDNFNNSRNTPNGWPPDVDQWVVIDDTDSPFIQLTLDNFATYLDKTGNVVTVFSTWSSVGTASGFALPRVGINA